MLWSVKVLFLFFSINAINGIVDDVKIATMHNTSASHQSIDASTPPNSSNISSRRLSLSRTSSTVPVVSKSIPIENKVKHEKMFKEKKEYSSGGKKKRKSNSSNMQQNRVNRVLFKSSIGNDTINTHRNSNTDSSYIKKTFNSTANTYLKAGDCFQPIVPKKSIPVYWVNLERSKNRKKFFTLQMDEMGLRHTRQVAVTPWDEVVKKTKLNVLPKVQHTQNELSCVISHLLAIYSAIHDTTSR